MPDLDAICWHLAHVLEFSSLGRYALVENGQAQNGTYGELRQGVGSSWIEGVREHFQLVLAAYE